MSAVEQQIEIEIAERFFYERWQKFRKIEDYHRWYKWKKKANKAYWIAVACGEAEGVDGDF